MARSRKAGRKGTPDGPLAANDSIENAIEDLLRKQMNAPDEAAGAEPRPPPEPTLKAAGADDGDFADEQTLGYDELSAVADREAALDELYRDPRTWEEIAEEPEPEVWERQTLIGVGGFGRGDDEDDDPVSGR